MAVVHIPTHMRHTTNGEATVEVPGGRLGKVIDALLAAQPALRDEIMLEGRVRPDISIAINSSMTENGLLEEVPDDAEVHLVPAIGGGGGSSAQLR
jgi:molybdopterin converting factor small subunit